MTELTPEAAPDDDFMEGWKPGAGFVRRVVASAVQYGKGKDALVVCSARHFDKRMNHTLRYMREEKLFPFEVAGHAEQGFIDQLGVFMDREEAWFVAVHADQLIDRCPAHAHVEERLYSEWVW